MEIGKRATRGRRNAELEGEALEEDKLFWNDEVWKEDESDDSFETEEENDHPDEFDSDFNDTEDDDESISGEDVKETQVFVIPTTDLLLYSFSNGLSLLETKQ